MKIGVWLHDHFYRKHCGLPMYGLEKRGWFLLNMDEVCRATPEVLKDLNALGVECAEVGGPLGRLEAMIPVLKETGGIEIILHAEGDPSTVKCGSKNPHTRRAAVENLKRNIDIAAEIKSPLIVLHPPPFSESTVRILRDCCRYAEKNDVILALENSGRGKPGIEAASTLREAAGSAAMEYTLDTGHANLDGSPLECTRMLGERIAHVHWHDNNGTKDQHLAPGMGNIDFPPLMRLLLQIDAKRKREITLTLECDKPGVDYEEEFRKLRELREKCERCRTEY